MSACTVVDWLICRIVRKCRKGYQLYCRKGILDRTYPSGELTSLSDDSSITLDVWRQASRISFKSVIDDPTCMQTCNCVLSKSVENVLSSLTVLVLMRQVLVSQCGCIMQCTL